MFLHNSNIALQSYLPTLSRIMILISKHPKCPTRTKLALALIAFFFWNQFSQIAVLEGVVNIVSQSFMRCGHFFDVPTKITMPHSMICFHIHASKFLQTQAISLYLHCFQPSSIQKLMINLSNYCCDIVIRTSSLLGYFGLKSLDLLKTSKSRNMLFNLP